MELTEFTPERRALHLRMAAAYQGFLHYLFVQNKTDIALQMSMNEMRIKFLSLYFATHAPVATIFTDNVRLVTKKSLDRRYIIADYFSENALVKLRAFPARRMGLKFEHVIPKDRLRQKSERSISNGSDILSVDEIAEMLNQTWHIAVVTDEEDRELHPQKRMPQGWEEGDDIFARYRAPDCGTLRFQMYRSNEDAESCLSILRA